MSIRSLAAAAALCLIGAASPSVSSEITDAPTAMVVATAQGTAPNFVGISNWYNSAPLSIGSLRGKVVLVDFWTYNCVNCIHTLPRVTALYMPNTTIAGWWWSASIPRNSRSNDRPLACRRR